MFGCAAMSPSLWWDREYFLRTLKIQPEWLTLPRVAGRGRIRNRHPEGSATTIDRTRRLAARFAECGMCEGEHFRYAEVPGATHNEASWGGRFDEVLEVSLSESRSRSMPLFFSHQLFHDLREPLPRLCFAQSYQCGSAVS